MDVRVSKSNNLGESDLIVVYVSDYGERFALLIEDKVDAPLQHEQATRYRLRAERDRRFGIYSDYEVLLCAPRFYIENCPDPGNFDHKISLEEIADIIRVKDDVRANYRASFLENAGTKRINAWLREDDGRTNEFWDSAYALATREFPTLEMKPLKLTKDSTWITFRPRDFPTYPKHIYLSFKGDRGQMDLTFGNTTAYLFQSAIVQMLEPDMSVHQTGASAAVRIDTPGFVISGGIAEGLPKTRLGFEASSRLIALYRRKRMELDRAAEAATPA